MVEQISARGHGNDAERKAREARDHPALAWMARIGFATYGVVYVVVGVLAAQLALGDSSGKVSGQGALHEVAEQPFGSIALVVAACGLGALTVWQVCEAIGGHTDRDGARRLASRAGSAGRAVVFATLAVLAVQVVVGDSSGGGTDGYTARLLALPFGQALVVAVGLFIVGLGLNSIHKGLSDRWRRDLEYWAGQGDTGTALAVLARTGFSARGVAFCLIGGLLVWAGVTHDAQKSAGLDQALHRLLRDVAYGPWLLGAIAVGLAAYGLFNIAKAWALRDK
ncbi:DUF1206 domain-containing protein [Nocardioides immobilis]|uniref:DUF1206 domain-containing protein n=1 Tax=Nocardioides immobilis TaxID=2049295 RepID=A0A417XY18_9ACTN|nr:DUF1206 domain-containing protein [Nocardioides immobilis]RHW25322.1 DUF1206 domain-containing protein [Nocardioides immobilis]